MRSVVWIAFLVGGTACDPAHAQPSPGPAPAPPPARAPAPAVVIPTELSAAPMWIGRTFHTGMIARQHTHETQILRRHGVLALLTIELRVAQSQMFEIGTWKAQPVTTYVGTSKQTAKVVTLDLTNMADATDRISMQCRTTTIAAAPPTAVRRATIPDHVEECGDEGRWQPRTTKRMTVLRCADDDSTSDDAPDLAFAPSPGIEWLYVNDDCLQGGGWRQVPADRSIVTKVRPGKKP